MKRTLLALCLCATLTSCQPRVITIDPMENPKVLELLTSPDKTEEEIRAALEKLVNLSEGTITAIKEIDGKIVIEAKSPEEEAGTTAARTFGERLAQDGPIGALLVAVGAGLLKYSQSRSRKKVQGEVTKDPPASV